MDGLTNSLNLFDVQLNALNGQSQFFIPVLFDGRCSDVFSTLIYFSLRLQLGNTFSFFPFIGRLEYNDHKVM